MRRGPEDRGQLGLKQLRLQEREANGAEAECRVGGRGDLVTQCRGQLLTADIQGPDGDGPPGHAFHDFPQGLVLLVLCRQGHPVHEHELGAEKPDTLRTRPVRGLNLAGEFEIGVENDVRAVLRLGRQGPEPRELPL